MTLSVPNILNFDIFHAWAVIFQRMKIARCDGQLPTFYLNEDTNFAIVPRKQLRKCTCIEHSSDLYLRFSDVLNWMCKCVNFKIWSLRILWCKNFKNLIQIFYLSDVRSTEKKFNSIFPETNVYCDLMKYFVSHALMECVDVYHTFKSIIIRWRYSLSSLTKVFSVKGIDKP